MNKQVFRLLSCVAAVAITSHFAQAQPTERMLSHENFFSHAFGNWQRLNGWSISNADLKAGETGFLSISQLIRGQDEISVDNILAKLDKKISTRDVVVSGGVVQLAHDWGRSLVPVVDPIEVVKGPLGYLILDGHHDVYLTLALNGKTIAAEVKRDYSHLSVEEFWKKMREEDVIYLKASNEELVTNPPRMTDVVDNPNRYAAGMIALKAKMDKSQGNPSVLKVEGPNKPVWIKVGNGVPFIEFYIAKALSEAGFIYRSEWGSVMPDEAVEQARLILLKAKRTSKYPQLRTLIVIESPESAVTLKNDKSILEQRIKNEIESEKRVRCEMIF